MKTKFFHIIMCMCLLVGAISLVSCGDDDDDEMLTEGGSNSEVVGGISKSSLIGTWEFSDDYGIDRVTLKPDGTGNAYYYNNRTGATSNYSFKNWYLEDTEFGVYVTAIPTTGKQAGQRVSFIRNIISVTSNAIYTLDNEVYIRK